MPYYYVPGPGATVAATRGGYPVGYTPLETDMSMYSPRPYVNYVRYRPEVPIAPNPVVDTNRILDIAEASVRRRPVYTPMAPAQPRSTSTVTGTRQAQPQQPQQPRGRVDSRVVSAESIPIAQISNTSADVAPAAPTSPIIADPETRQALYAAQNFLASRGQNIPSNISQIWDWEKPEDLSWDQYFQIIQGGGVPQQNTASLAASAAPSSTADSAYWNTPEAQNLARRALGLEEVSGGTTSSNIPAQLTTPPDLAARLRAQQETAMETGASLAEVSAVEPLAQGVVVPEVSGWLNRNTQAVGGPLNRNTQFWGGPITPPIQESVAPSTLATDTPSTDLPVGARQAADLYYNVLRPGYQRNVAPVLDAAGDTLSAAANVGADIATQAYNEANTALNSYWADFFYNKFGQRGPLTGQNLQNYLDLARNLGFYNEAMQRLGGN